jgi:hypothetical protein
MNILGAIKREERQIERQLNKLRRRLDGFRAAARVLGSSANHATADRKKRVLSAAGRARIVAAVKKRWAKVRAQTKKNR